MGRVIMLGLAGVVALFATLLAAFTLGFRAKWPPLLDRVRRFNRDVTNRHQMRTAGQHGVTYAVVEHVGRRSGRGYRTPVGAVPTPDGFVVGLPYGPGADWVRNVLAAGGATVEHDGRAVTVVRPELTDRAAVTGHFGAAERLVQRLYGVDDFLLLREADQTVA
ncbi:MAG: nitroreductase family deazaflavin-dependent oxidoreductase [Actinobacteria bacterium]|jgi:deazaflavin-dependent oxidoreductase (nitroreductase family)|nr:nitroreductase family deazaflavin-dependent oxidoreductase [Actinomycetota bacterium]